MTENKPTGETMSDGSPEMEMPEMEMGGIEAPVSSLNGAKVGQTVTLTIESIDDESGMAVLKPAGNNSNMNPEPSTISKAAALFDGE